MHLFSLAVHLCGYFLSSNISCMNNQKTPERKLEKMLSSLHSDLVKLLNLVYNRLHTRLLGQLENLNSLFGYY